MASTLLPFSDPRSVAVVGASANPSKWGYWLARGAMHGSDRRSVHLVNSGGASIDGVTAARSLSELPEVPELVVLSCPAATVPDVVEEALALGSLAFLGITAGIDAATGQPGLQQGLADRIRAAGARLVGPNCLGVYDAATDLELAWGDFTPGALAVVSQSGQLGLEIAGMAAHAGLGIARFVSVGDQADVTAVEVLEDLAGHPLTRAVVVYLEGFEQGRQVVAALGRLREAGRPAIVLTVGAGAASQAAARSHTGALTSGTEVVAAACQAAGAVLVRSPAEAVDLARLLLGGAVPDGRRIGVVSDSGGQGALAADLLEHEGLAVPRLSEAASGRVAALLPAGAGVANPVDLAGSGEKDLTTYARVVEEMLAGGEVDAVVLSGYFGRYGTDTPGLLDAELAVSKELAASVAQHGRPLVVHSMSPDSDAVASLTGLGVPTTFTVDAAARSLALATALREAEPRRLGPVPAPWCGPGVPLPYLAALERLAAAGLRHPVGQLVRGSDAVSEAADRLGAPYVLKASWLEHKTEVGGVAVDLADAAAAVAAYERMLARLGPGDYVLEEQDTRTGVVELIVGARQDPAFGPVVLVGLGGVQAELFRDVALALAPVDEGQARRLLESLRALPLLQGWRGRRAVDLEAACAAVVAVSRLPVDDPSILECEVNPLRVGPDGALAVDALVLAAPDPMPVEVVRP